MKPFFMTIAILCAALFGRVVSAQTASPERATRDAAREMVNLTMSDEAYNAIVDQAAEALAGLWWATAGEPTIAEMAQRGIKATAEDEARMKALMRTIVRRVFLELCPRSDVVETVASVWAQHLSVDDMNEIIRFYKTPVGSKAIGLTGKMIVEMNKASVELFEPKSATFWERAKAELMKEAVLATTAQPTPAVQAAPQPEPTPADESTALKLRADQGDVAAQFDLAIKFSLGDGVPQDWSQAAWWFRKAADQGLAVAQGNLGGLYDRGRGVPQDNIEAHKWLSIAAAGASGPDQTKLLAYRDTVAAKMTPSQLTEAHIRASEWMAAFEKRRANQDMSGMLAGSVPASGGGSNHLPLRVGGSIAAPRKIKDVKPNYPLLAQSAHIQGVVTIEAVIGPNGKVTDARVIRSIPALDQAALDAVRQWEFTPTLLSGVAVPVIMTVWVKFSLQ